MKKTLRAVFRFAVLVSLFVAGDLFHIEPCKNLFLFLAWLIPLLAIYVSWAALTGRTSKSEVPAISGYLDVFMVGMLASSGYFATATVWAIGSIYWHAQKADKA